MFTSVRIQNFRQFRDLKLEGLGQINLITGANDTGKTSLLEALFLLDGPLDPRRTLVMADFRGIGGYSPDAPELWEWLFRDRDLRRAAELAWTGHDDLQRQLKLSVAAGGLLPAIVNGTPQASDRPSLRVASAESLPTLVYEYLGPSGEQEKTTLGWTSQGLILAPDRSLGMRQGFFLPDYHRPGVSEAERLSRLVETGRDAVLVEALQSVEPRLKRLTVLTHGGRPGVHADLDQYPLVPLMAMGSGVGKLLTTISAMILEEGPVFLIDEIGGGFHYSVLVDVWKVIVETAVKHSVQIFATTHSWECIEAAVKASEDHAGKLALFRLERHKDEIRAVDIEDEDLRSAVGLGVELR